MPIVRFKRRSIIEPVGVHVYPNLKEKELRPTSLWPFYRKMRVLNWKPLEHILELEKENGKLRSRLVYRFKHDKTNRILNMHISRHEQLYFTVIKDSEVYQSKFCDNYSDFDKAFCLYFRRKRPVLEQKPGF